MISRCSRPRKPQRKPKPSAADDLRLEMEARVVEAQLGQALAQLLEFRRVGREEAAEHHRHAGLEARQGGGGPALLGDGVADLAIGHFLDAGGDEADLAGAQRRQLLMLGREDADLVHLMGRAGRHHADLHPGLEHAVLHPHQDDDAEIGVVPAVDQQGLERGVCLARGRRQARDQGLQHIGDAEAGLGRDQQGIRGVEADHILDLLAHLLGLGRGQVDLVEDRDDLVVVLDGLIDIGQGLGLDPLGRIDHQQRALAGREAPAHLIGEVDMAGRVHQVEGVGLAVLGRCTSAARSGP